MLFVIRKIVLGIIFLGVLAVMVALARGYRFNFVQKSLSPTGIIVASSYPDGAMILVNNQLKGATNSNISMPPGEYDVEIKKDGFTSWKKHFQLKGELVVKADALLIPQNPTLSPVTSLGISKAFSSTSGDKIVILSDTQNIEKDGIYLFENVRNPLSRINPLKLLILKSAFSNLPSGVNFSNMLVEFSPDEEQILVTFTILSPATVEPPIPPRTYIYLLDSTKLSTQPFDVTESVATIREAWQADRQLIMKKAYAGLKKPIGKVAESAFDIIAFSPDEHKILYTASQSATLPQVIVPPLVAGNQTPEERDIKEGNIYIYDEEEDKNFKILSIDEFESLEDAKKSLLWYPDSAHIVIKEDTKFSVMDYDGSNRMTVYSGPFDQSFYALSKDGKIFILTNFNSATRSVFDMYGIGLK